MLDESDEQLQRERRASSLFATRSLTAAQKDEARNAGLPTFPADQIKAYAVQPPRRPLQPLNKDDKRELAEVIRTMNTTISQITGTTIGTPIGQTVGQSLGARS